MDFIYLGLGALLWVLMVLLVRGLERLAPTGKERP
jgi:hypothetical protein